jgi:Flp pilus assembly protein TadG
MRQLFMNAMTFCMPRVLRRLARDRRGSSAVEFAIIAPLMIGLYIGCVEISDGVAADRKVTLTAGALANLASQVQTISATEMTNIMNAATAIISPYSAGNLTTTVTCIKIDAAKVATVGWSATVGGTALATGSAVTDVPPEIKIASSSLVLSEVTYLYRPVTGYIPAWSHIAATGITLRDKMYMSPRITAPVYDDGSGGKSCTP